LRRVERGHEWLLDAVAEFLARDAPHRVEQPGSWLWLERDDRREDRVQVTDAGVVPHVTPSELVTSGILETSCAERGESTLCVPPELDLVAKPLADEFRESRVGLDGDHLGADLEQASRHVAGPRPDLQHVHPRLQSAALAENPVDLLRIRQGDAIHPGGPSVYPDPLPRLPQDVTPADTVIQGMETPLRRLLGRSP